MGRKRERETVRLSETEQKLSLADAIRLVESASDNQHNVTVEIQEAAEVSVAISPNNTPPTIAKKLSPLDGKIEIKSSVRRKEEDVPALETSPEVSIKPKERKKRTKENDDPPCSPEQQAERIKESAMPMIENARSLMIIDCESGEVLFSVSGKLGIKYDERHRIMAVRLQKDEFICKFVMLLPESAEYQVEYI